MKVKKCMEIKDFTYFLLAKLANKSQIINLRDKNIKTIMIPTNYKQVIENIMCAGNGWDERFSILIDKEEYFDNHFVWETKFAVTLQEVLQEMQKPYKYDFIGDRLLIQIKQEQVDEILSKYPGRKLNDVMDHFANLFVDYIFTREYQENYHDLTAAAIQRMKAIKAKRNENELGAIPFKKTRR